MGSSLALAPHPSSPSSPLVPPRFPGVQFNSLPSDRRTLLSERLEQATRCSAVVLVCQIEVCAYLQQR